MNNKDKSRSKTLTDHINLLMARFYMGERPEPNQFGSALSFNNEDHLAPMEGTFYVRDKNKKIVKKLNTDYADILADATKFRRSLLSILQSFGDLLTSYDWDVILPSTCALSYTKGHHVGEEEMPWFYAKRNYEIPDEYAEALVSLYSPKMSADHGMRLSMPRGRNCGWPTLVSGRDRETSDVLLAAHTAVALGGQKTGMKLQDVLDIMSHWYGSPFSATSYRGMHTPKNMPCHARGRFLNTINFEYRLRIIVMQIKFAVIWNRVAARTLQGAIKKTSLHEADRGQIRNIISKMLNDFDCVFSIDVSKYDLRMGGQSTVSLLLKVARPLLAKVYGDSVASKMIADIITEISVPLAVETPRGMAISTKIPILPSGSSVTTVVGCFGSAFLVLFLASTLLGISPAETLSRRGQDWEALTYGDDVVFAIKSGALSKKGLSKEEVLHEISDIAEGIGLPCEAEPTIKFLGQNYDMLDYAPEASCGYPLGRFVQQQFFPERPKQGPFATVGFLARLSLMADELQKEVFSRVMSEEVFPLARLPKQFKFEDREAMIAECVKEMEKWANHISDIDDIMAIFTHGLVPDEVDYDLGIFSEFLGLGYVDVSDPQALVENKKLRDLVGQIASGDLASWPNLVKELCLLKGWLPPAAGSILF